MYRLDRQAFAIQNFQSAADQRAYWLSKSAAERLAAAWYLMCAAWNLNPDEPQRLDRQSFSIRTREVYAAKHI